MGLKVSKAKDVYAKIQTDLATANKERAAINNRIERERTDMAQTEDSINTFVNDLLPIAQTLLPQIFDEKKQLAKEVSERSLAQSSVVKSLQMDLIEATAKFEQAKAEHDVFKQDEQRRLRNDPIYSKAYQTYQSHDEASNKAVVDALQTKIDGHEETIATHWLMNVAYHNTFGQSSYETGHFLQELFGRVCLQIKSTNRYRSLVQDVEIVKAEKVVTLMEMETKRAAAATAKNLCDQLRQESDRQIEQHSQDSDSQKILLETVEATFKTASKEMDTLVRQAVDIDAWKHPTALKAYQNFRQALLDKSDETNQVRTVISKTEKAALLIRGIDNELARKQKTKTELENLNFELNILVKAIDKLETLSRDMRRKSLDKSNREMATGSAYMNGGTFDSGFDLTTLVTAATFLNTVIETTPSDTVDNSSTSSFSSSSFSSDF